MPPQSRVDNVNVDYTDKSIRFCSIVCCLYVYTALIDVIYYTDNTTARRVNDFSIKFYVNNIEKAKPEIGICNNVMKPPPTVEFCNH